MKRQKPQRAPTEAVRKVRRHRHHDLSLKSKTLRNKLKPEQTQDEAVAELVVAGLGANALAGVKVSAAAYGEVDLTAMPQS